MQSSQSNADEPRLHHRQQLSAMIDGELEADQASFLLRRLEHDDRLARYQLRWQRYGQLMRESALCSRSQWRPTATGPAQARARGLARQNRLTAHLATRPRWLIRCAQVAMFCLVALNIQQSVSDQPILRSQSPLVVVGAEQARAALVTWPILHAVAPDPLSRAALTARAPRTSVRLPVMSIIQPLNLAKAEVGFGAHPLPARPWPRTLLPEQSSFNADYRANQWDAQPLHRSVPFPRSALPQIPTRAKEGDL